MLRSTSALLDRPTARAVLSRFGAEDGEEPEDDSDETTDAEAAEAAQVSLEFPSEVPKNWAASR